MYIYIYLVNIMESQHIINVIGDIFDLNCKSDIITTKYEIKSGMFQEDIKRIHQTKIQIDAESDFLNNTSLTLKQQEQKEQKQKQRKQKEQKQQKQKQKTQDKRQVNQQTNQQMKQQYEYYYDDYDGYDGYDYDGYDEDEAYYREYERLYDKYYSYK